MAKFLSFLIIFLTTISPGYSEDLSKVDIPAVSQSGQFKNKYPDRYPNGSFIKWQLDKLFQHTPGQFSAPPIVKPNIELIKNTGGKIVVTWIGHSTLLYQCDGINFITDPMFSDYASPLPPFGPKRMVPPGLKVTQLPHIHVVLISHNHYDHLDLDSVRELANQAGEPPLFYVPLGLKKWLLENVGILNTPENVNKVKEFNWGQSTMLNGDTHPFQITFLSVHHWSMRTLLDHNESLWGSWAIVHPDFKFWFSGDLAYSKDSLDIGNKFNYFDLAAIAIGSYEPRWFMENHHINPEEAVKVMEDIHAKQAIGIHWGVFRLSDEPPMQPASDLKDALLKHHIDQDRFIVLNIGESKIYNH